MQYALLALTTPLVRSAQAHDGTRLVSKQVPIVTHGRFVSAHVMQTCNVGTVNRDKVPLLRLYDTSACSMPDGPTATKPARNSGCRLDTVVSFGKRFIFASLARARNNQ